MDLSGIYINSTAAARVRATLLMRNAARSSRKDADLGKGMGEGRGRGEGRVGSSAHSGQMKQCQLGGTTLYVNVAQRPDGSDFNSSILHIQLTSLQHKVFSITFHCCRCRYRGRTCMYGICRAVSFPTVPLIKTFYSTRRE